MKAPWLFLVLLACACASAMDAPAVPGDAGDLFMRGYAAAQQGERLDAAGEREGAKEKYREADELLQALRANYPEWNKAIVEYRAAKLREALERVGLRKPEAKEAPAREEAFRGSPADPSEIFLMAYTGYQRAEKLEGSKATKEALEQYRVSGELLQLLRRRHVDWNITIVEYRARRVADALTRLGIK